MHLPGCPAVSGALECTDARTTRLYDRHRPQTTRNIVERIFV